MTRKPRVIVRTVTDAIKMLKLSPAKVRKGKALIRKMIKRDQVRTPRVVRDQVRTPRVVRDQVRTPRVVIRTPYPTAEDIVRDLGITPSEKKRMDRLLADTIRPKTKWPSRKKNVCGSTVTYRTCPYCGDDFSDDRCLAKALNEIARLREERRMIKRWLRNFPDEADVAKARKMALALADKIAKLDGKTLREGYKKGGGIVRPVSAKRSSQG